jgi:ubiquinone/menaquinone biosynthesis C-methylase UbiE
MMHDAFKVWDNAAEPLSSVEARIHDGVPIGILRDRAAGYVKDILSYSTVRLSPGATVVEVGSGVGYIMEAFARGSGVKRVTGLDVAPNMIERARERLSRDGVDIAEFDFKLYDGKVFPWPDRSVDFFYSVATIQHIPKPYAYNVLFEMQRCLKPGGGAVVHLLGWDQLSMHNYSFADEVQRQIGSQVSHWHHFYDKVELQAIADNAIKPSSLRITPVPGSIWLSWTK